MKKYETVGQVLLVSVKPFLSTKEREPFNFVVSVTCFIFLHLNTWINANLSMDK